MNKNLLTGSLFCAAAISASLSGLAARADQVTTTFLSPTIVSARTTTTKTCSTIAGQGMLVTSVTGQEVMVPVAMNPNQILYVTTGATITGFTCCSPDDLITRRDDLLARIFAEKFNGKLTSEQANGLTNEVESAFGAITALSSGDESNVEHVKGVKRIYRQFDRISNDILKDSRQGNKDLAGKYNYIVL